MNEDQISEKLRKMVNLSPEIIKEALEAMTYYEPFNSMHEGYAVILEELEELWMEIKKKPLDRNKEEIKKEAIQTGAMIYRFLVDCID